MKEQHTAVVIGPDGSLARFHPAFKRGNHESEKFAKTANLAMRDGGVSIAISQTYNLTAVKKAIEFLERIGD